MGVMVGCPQCFGHIVCVCVLWGVILLLIYSDYKKAVLQWQGFVLINI